MALVGIIVLRAVVQDVQVIVLTLVRLVVQVLVLDNVTGKPARQ